VMFYRSAEHYLGSPDNMMMGFDFKLTPIKNVKFYGELLIDDITTSKLGTGWYGNKFALLGGIFFAEPFKLDNFDLRLEYVRIRPYVYTHENSVQYTHYNSSLGHWIGPNSDLLMVRINYQMTMRLSFGGSYCYLRHGGNSENKNAGANIDLYHLPNDDLYVNLLEGIRENRCRFGFNLSYEIFRNFNIQAFFWFTREKKLLVLQNKWDKIASKYFGLTIGLNY